MINCNRPVVIVMMMNISIIAIMISKVYLYPLKYFWYVKETHFSNVLHQHSEKKIINKQRNDTFKVPKCYWNQWVWQKTTA